MSLWKRENWSSPKDVLEVFFRKVTPAKWSVRPWQGDPNKQVPRNNTVPPLAPAMSQQGSPSKNPVKENGQTGSPTSTWHASHHIRDNWWRAHWRNRQIPNPLHVSSIVSGSFLWATCSIFSVTQLGRSLLFPTILLFPIIIIGSYYYFHFTGSRNWNSERVSWNSPETVQKSPKIFTLVDGFESRSFWHQNRCSFCYTTLFLRVKSEIHGHKLPQDKSLLLSVCQSQAPRRLITMMSIPSLPHPLPSGWAWPNGSASKSPEDAKRELDHLRPVLLYWAMLHSYSYGAYCIRPSPGLQAGAVRASWCCQFLGASPFLIDSLTHAS